MLHLLGHNPRKEGHGLGQSGTLIASMHILEGKFAGEIISSTNDENAQLEVFKSSGDTERSRLTMKKTSPPNTMKWVFKFIV